MAGFYPEFAASTAAESRDAVRLVRAGIRDEIADLKRALARAKKAKPKKLVCIDPGAGQPPVCSTTGNGKGALRKAKAELKARQKQMAAAIREAEKRLAKVK